MKGLSEAKIDKIIQVAKTIEVGSVLRVHCRRRVYSARDERY